MAPRRTGPSPAAARGTATRRAGQGIAACRAGRAAEAPGHPQSPAAARATGAVNGATSQPFVEHLGSGTGFFNLIRTYPTRGVGAAVMGNATSYPIDAAARLALTD